MRMRVGNKVYRFAGPIHYIPSWEDMWKEVQSIHGKEEDDEDVYRKIYDEAVGMLQEFSSKDVWRSMSIPETVDPTTLTNLGIYWADSEYGVDTVFLDYYDEHWKGYGQGREVVYHARVDGLSNVDTYGTVEARVIGWGQDEEEVRLFGGVPIYVYDVTLEDGTVVPINDWRTT